MLYNYVEKGTSFVRVHRKSKGLLYYKKKKNFSVEGDVIGYLYLGDLHKLKTPKVNAADQMEMHGYYFNIEKEEPNKKLPIKGYLLVKGQNNEDYHYVAMYSKHRYMGKLNFAFILGLSQISVPSSAIAAAAITVAVTATAVKVVPMLINDSRTPKADSPTKITQDVKDNITSPDQDRTGVVTYDGTTKTNGQDSVETPQDSDTMYDYILYFDLYVKPGEAIPLVNEITNKDKDVQFNYVIKDKNGTVLVDKWVKPGEAYPWVPNLPEGVNVVSFSVNVWSLDGKTKGIGQDFDVKITINK